MAKRAVALIFLIREQPPLYADVSSLPWSLLDHQPRAEALCPVQSPVYSSSSGSTGQHARQDTLVLAISRRCSRKQASRRRPLRHAPHAESPRRQERTRHGRVAPGPSRPCAAGGESDAARVLDGLSARRREQGCAHPIFVQEPRARDAERLGSTHQEGELGFREARTGRRYHTRIILDYSVLPDTLISTSLSARSCPQRASSAAAVPVAVEPSLPVRLDLEVVLEL